MEFLVYLLAMIFFMALLMSIFYFRILFADGRDQYRREEILYFYNKLVPLFVRLFDNNNISLYAGFISGIVFSFITSFFGGIFFEYYESYFFNSAILTAAAYFSLNFLKNGIVDPNQVPPMVMANLNNKMPFLLGMSISIAGRCLTVYGFYHEVHFLWIFCNLLALIGISLYELQNQGIVKKR